MLGFTDVQVGFSEVQDGVSEVHVGFADVHVGFSEVQDLVGREAIGVVIVQSEGDKVSQQLERRGTSR